MADLETPFTYEDLVLETARGSNQPVSVVEEVLFALEQTVLSKAKHHPRFIFQHLGVLKIVSENGVPKIGKLAFPDAAQGDRIAVDSK